MQATPRAAARTRTEFRSRSDAVPRRDARQDQNGRNHAGIPPLAAPDREDRRTVAHRNRRTRDRKRRTLREGAITGAEARAAGFASVADLLADLDGRDDGDLYRIAFRFDRPDPRIALRAADDLSAEDLAALTGRLDRLDKGTDGAWTRPALHYIAANEGQPAAMIAEAFGIEKLRLKQNIRKLKELGLTESLETGYRLSPRGKALLDALPR